MKIIYIGDSNPTSTSAHRANALVRLGHLVTRINPNESCNDSLRSAIWNRIHYRTGYMFLQPKIKSWLKEKLAEVGPADLIWVNGGELLGGSCVKFLKTLGIPVILYNNDDPTGGRDTGRFGSLLTALKHYDLCAVLRDINIPEYKARGARNVIRVNMSYDEVIHKPYDHLFEIPVQFRSDVAFIGTWMRHENRDQFLLELIAQKISVSIWGDHWHKSPYWEQLKPYYKGKALSGRDYVAAIQGAKICIGMLSKGNRDLHTRRSVEIPYIGGLFCAERTTEHEAMFQEGQEAVFWKDAAECAEICKTLLADDTLRERIKVSGMKKVRLLSVGNEDIAAKILKEVCT